MVSRKGQKRDILNSIRLTMLDWDPMNLFDLGQAGIEEYDEYIPAITKSITQKMSIEDFETFLVDYAKTKMGVAVCHPERTKKAAEKLHQFSLE